MPTKDISKVLIVGAGTMGHGIAQVFARKGFWVAVYDQDPKALQKARASITQELSFLLTEEAITPEVRDWALANLNWVSELSTVAGDVELVVEAIIEDVNTKQELFARLGQLCRPGTILSSNTSGISISKIAEAVERPREVVGMHWWNPPYLIPVIEIIKGNLTSAQTMEKIKEVTLSLDKKPVLVNKDVPGFLGNRMQYALMREALCLLEEGVASAEDIDLMVRAGFGFKFPVMGPLETIDMAGFDIYQKVSAYLYPYLCNSVEPHRLIEEKIKFNQKGIKNGAGFYQYSEFELPVLLQGRISKLLVLLKEMGYRV